MYDILHVIDNITPCTSVNTYHSIFNFIFMCAPILFNVTREISLKCFSLKKLRSK